MDTCATVLFCVFAVNGIMTFIAVGAAAFVAVSKVIEGKRAIPAVEKQHIDDQPVNHEEILFPEPKFQNEGERLEWLRDSI